MCVRVCNHHCHLHQGPLHFPVKISTSSQQLLPGWVISRRASPGCQLPRRQEIPSGNASGCWAHAFPAPNAGAPWGWRPCPPVSGSGHWRPALHPLGPPSCPGAGTGHRVRGSPSRTMARLSWGYGEHNGERGLQRGQVPASGRSEPRGWMGVGAGVPCALSGRTEVFSPLHTKSPPLSGESLRGQKTDDTLVRIKDNLRAAWALISKSRDAFQRLLEKSW